MCISNCNLPHTISVDAPSGTLIIACDTVVVLDRDLLGKPGSAAGAVAMLRRLRGQQAGAVPPMLGEAKAMARPAAVPMRPAHIKASSRFATSNSWT